MQPASLKPIKDLMAGLARDSNPPETSRPRPAGWPASHKLQSFIHYRTLLPRHHSLPFTGKSVTYVSGTMCYLCLRPLKSAPLLRCLVGFSPKSKPESASRRFWSCRCCRWRRSHKLGIVHRNILLNPLDLNGESVARSRLRPAERHLHTVRVAIVRVINLRRVGPKRGLRVPNQPQQQP